MSSPVLENKDSGSVQDVGRKLERYHFVFVPGTRLSTLLGVSPDQTQSFAAHWSRLTRDEYMGDGGTYRYRRYGEFECSTEGVRFQLPHGPYEQPKYINTLNGGVPRMFEPLEPEFANHVVLTAFLDWLTALFNDCEKQSCRWNIRLHPYRIVATSSQQGNPTPEGLHRDGVTYVVSLLMQRRHVQGGETTVTDEGGHALLHRTLMHPLDLIVGDDRKTLHSVTPLKPIFQDAEAYRDVLVVAFTRLSE